jgi:hypothetical protein
LDKGDARQAKRADLEYPFASDILTTNGPAFATGRVYPEDPLWAITGGTDEEITPDDERLSGGSQVSSHRHRCAAANEQEERHNYRGAARARTPFKVWGVKRH